MLFPSLSNLTKAIRYNDTVCVASVIDAEQTDDYVARWSFDDVSGTAVPNNENISGVTTHQGTTVGSPTRDVGYDGLANGSMAFDGSTQYVTIPEATALKPTAHMYLTAWVKTSITDADDRCVVFQMYNETASVFSGYRLRIQTQNEGGQVVFRVARNTGNVLGTDYQEVTSTEDVTDGEWHFIVARHNPTTNVIGISVDNGTEVTSAWTGNISYHATTNYCRIGRGETGIPVTEDYMQGSIDDVRLYNHQVTADEITHIYTNYFIPRPQDMIAYYKFNNDILDETTNNYDLTEVSATSYITGWEGTSASFNGGTNHLYRTETDFHLQTFSVAFWANLDVTETGTGLDLVNCFIWEGSGALTSHGWRVSCSDAGTVSFGTYDGTTATSPQVSAVASAGMTPGEWFHCVAVHTPTAIQLWIDGILIDEDVTTSLPIDFNVDTRFGVSGRYREIDVFAEVDADMDELRFYDRVLVQAEIEALALSRDAGCDPLAPTVPSYTAVTLDIDVASITENTASSELWTSETLTATPSNGSGQFTYLWTTDGSATITSPTSATTTVSYTADSGTLSETITCTVTDINDGGTQASDTCPIAITFSYTEDYIAYWDFETANITGLVVDDQTANSHDLTMEETPVSADGWDGLGMSFPSTLQAGNAVDHADFKSTTFSMSAHVNRDSLTADKCIFHSGDVVSGNYQGWFVYITANGAVKFIIGDGSGAVQGTDWQTLSTTTGLIPVGTYKHVVCTYDGANMKIYVEGALEATQAETLTVTYPATNYVQVGCRSLAGTSYEYFLGDLDEIKIYDRALGSVEVTELYNLANTPETAPVPLSVDITGGPIGGIIFPSQSSFLSGTITGTVTGGTGPFTYLWTEEAGGTGTWTIDNPTSNTTTFSVATLGAGEIETTFRLTVTDTGNGSVTVYDTIFAFINNGAV